MADGRTGRTAPPSLLAIYQEPALDKPALPCPIRAFAIAGTNAYVAGARTLSVVDIAYPSSPQVIGSSNVPTIAEYVAVYGPYALVTNLNYGLRVFDVWDPTSPVEEDYYDTPGSSRVVVVTNGLIYVADQIGCLVIFSLREVEWVNTYLSSLNRT